MKTARDALEATLLGTALGDALGLPMEGMSRRTIARRFGALDRFRLVGRTGFVSDDTEQSALVAAASIRGRTDPRAVVRAFRRALLGWFARLPFGIGFGTLRACTRIALGLRRSGVRSAGNGAAMRSAIVGVTYADDEPLRREMAVAIAEVTHVDARALAGALYVAELAALAARAPPDAPRERLAAAAMGALHEPSMRRALEQAIELARSAVASDEATARIGTSGFVIHSVAIAAFAFVRCGDDPLAAVRVAIAAGGDTDSNAAIAGALAGALCGTSRLPAALVARIHDGPFGPTHLRALAAAIADPTIRDPPGFSVFAALVRNLALFPVVIAHGLRRLVPL